MRAIIYLECADYEQAKYLQSRIHTLIINTTVSTEHVIISTPRSGEFGVQIQTTQGRLPHLLEDMQKEGFL